MLYFHGIHYAFKSGALTGTGKYMSKLKKIVELGIGNWVLSNFYYAQPRPKKIKIINMDFEGSKEDTRKFLTLTDSSIF